MKRALIMSILLQIFIGISFGFDASALPSKVAIVDKSGLHYPDPVAAMDDLATWCGTPSETSRCLIRIMPGIYNLGTRSLVMKSYVDVEGSGENATTIKGRNPNGVVIGSEDFVVSEMRFLTVMHSGGSSEFSIAVAAAAAQKLTNLTIISEKGTEKNYGIYYLITIPEPPPLPPLTVKNVTVIASGGKQSVGIGNEFEGNRINIFRSSVKGDTNSIQSNQGQAFATDTVLNGPVGGRRTTTCKRVYDEDYTFFANTCP